jgi:hypothetical protein
LETVDFAAGEFQPDLSLPESIFLSPLAELAGSCGIHQASVDFRCSYLSGKLRPKINREDGCLAFQGGINPR